MPGAHNKRDAAAREQRFRNQQGSNQASLGAQPEPYDGPGSHAGESRGRSPAVSRTRSTSRPSSQVRVSSQTRQAGDPAREKPNVLLRNVDFGGAAYNMFDQVSPNLPLWHGSMSLCFPDAHCLACLSVCVLI